MPSRAYRAHLPHHPYFITTTVLDWVDVFTRPIYREIVVDSLRHCIAHKGLELNA